MKQSIMLALAGLVMASQACAEPAPVPWANLLSGASDVGAIGTTFDARQANVVCDGSTDDEASLNGVLAKAGEAARGGSARSLIYLPPAARPCILSRPLTVPSNVILFAQPGTVTLKPSISSTANVLILALNSAHNVLIYGIGFDGGLRDPSPVQNPARLALVYASQNVIFDHAAFRHSRGIGLEWSIASDSGVRNSEFVDIGNYWQQSGRREDRLAALNWDCPFSAGSVSVARAGSRARPAAGRMCSRWTRCRPTTVPSLFSNTCRMRGASRLAECHKAPGQRTPIRGFSTNT
jgi:hypothetical protein